MPSIVDSVARVVSLVVLAVALCVPAAGAPAASQIVDNLRLLDHHGHSHELHRLAENHAIVLISVGNGCPIVRQSVAAIKDLRDRFGPRGVAFLLINANAQDDRAAIAREAEAFMIDLPILKDEDQTVLAGLGVERTAEALVIRPSDWKVVYRGAIDDRLGYGTQKPDARHHYLEETLTALLDGGGVPTAGAEAKGCLIGYDPTVTADRVPDYAREVAPLLLQNCVTCHHEGGAGPFAMSGYAAVRGWAPMMREVLRTRRMPPWGADPVHGKFANDRSLNVAERQTLLRWLEAGAPAAADALDDPLAAHQPEEAVDWPLGPPEVIVELPQEQQIPATGAVRYRYVPIPLPLERGVWARGVDVRPSNRKATHHALVFVRYPEHLRDQEPAWHGGTGGYFGAYVPGQQVFLFPEGTGKFLPQGSTLILQLHYTPTGKPETDLTRVGLYLSEGEPRRELLTRAAANKEFLIPAGAAEHEVSASHTVREDVLLHELAPHMHYRGRRMSFEARYPDGSTEVLLSVPDYDFAWQSLYRLAQPKPLPAGTVITCRGAFDNSTANPSNPDPTKDVRFGEQSWDEMFIGYMNYSRPREAKQ